MALSDTMWQYRDVLFDLDTRLAKYFSQKKFSIQLKLCRMLRLAAGESIVERIDNVEDTKGNNGDRGLLRITNLRLIWVNIFTRKIFSNTYKKDEPPTAPQKRMSA